MQATTIGVVKENLILQQKGFFVSKSFNKGDILMSFAARETLNEPNYLTVQIKVREHILLAPIEIQYINHSCSPNIFFNTTTFNLEALENIKAGEEITFFYPSTEWKMEQPFTCSCDNINCLKTIQGAYYLKEQDVANYRFTEFILQQLTKEKIAVRA
jgi:hypothetical protein